MLAGSAVGERFEAEEFIDRINYTYMHALLKEIINVKYNCMHD